MGDSKFTEFVKAVCKNCPKCKVVIEKNEGMYHVHGAQLIHSLLPPPPLCTTATDD